MEENNDERSLLLELGDKSAQASHWLFRLELDVLHQRLPPQRGRTRCKLCINLLPIHRSSPYLYLQAFTIHDLTGQVTRTDPFATFTGGCSDVFSGEYGSIKVCICHIVFSSSYNVEWCIRSQSRCFERSVPLLIPKE
jgi:hypothetical protein